MRRPVVPDIWRQDIKSGMSDMHIGQVVSHVTGSGRVTVRLNTIAGKTVKDVIVAEKVELQQGNRVLLAQVSNGTWVAVCRVLDVDEYGLAVTEMTGVNELHPPDNFTVTGVTGFVLATWDCWAGNTICWEVEDNSSATYVGANVRYTRGGNHLYPSGSPVTRFMRVRAVRYDPATYTAYYSRWTAWSSATSIIGTSPSWANLVIVAVTGGDYSSVSAAETGLASVSDTVTWVMPGEYSEDIVWGVDGPLIAATGAEIGGNVQLVGNGDTGPIVDWNVSRTLKGFNISRTLAGGSGTYTAVHMDQVGESPNLSYCYISLDDGPTGRNLTGARVGAESGGESWVLQCRIELSGSGTNVAIRPVGTGDVIISGCNIIGDIVAADACDVYLWQSHVTGDVTGTSGANLYISGTYVSGTISGWDSVTYQWTVDEQAHIVDANGTLADITTKFNTLLSQLETLGLLASS